MTRRRLAPGVYCKKENVPKLLAELKRNGIDEPITDSYAVCGPVLTHERKFKLFVFRFAAGPEHEYIVL